MDKMYLKAINEISTIRSSNDDGVLQFSPITLNDDYRKIWDIREKDFICLTKDGELIRNTLYRIGGLNNPNPKKDEYFMLLKCTEAFYSDDITKNKTEKRHIKHCWCILDRYGNEKVEFDSFDSPYLVNNSQIYSIKGNYYNIETGEFYCHTSNSMRSSEFLFLDNRYDQDKERCGIMKINKKDGTWVLFS